MKNVIPFGQRITEGWDWLIEHLNGLYLTEEQIAVLTASIDPNGSREDDNET